MRDGDPLGVWFILHSLFCHTERCTVERQWAYQIHECTILSINSLRPSVTELGSVTEVFLHLAHGLVA
ncbi:unnamed protein product [Sphagnum troendelagicum]